MFMPPRASLDVQAGNRLASEGRLAPTVWRTATPVANRRIWRRSTARGEFGSRLLHGRQRSV